MKRLFRQKRLWAAILLLSFGLLKLPVEQRLTQHWRQQHILPIAPDISWRESMSQMGFASTLGGLRSLVASLTYLQAYVAFEKIEWGKVDSLMSLTTRLQPQEAMYWDEASWHMAYNAASSYLNDETLRSAIRQKLFRDHIDRGIAILEEGLKFLPNNTRILIRLGDIYNAKTPAQRRPNLKKSASYYLLAFENGANAHYERLAAYQLADLPDKDSKQQAYVILRSSYEKGIRNPSLQSVIPRLEAELNLPKTQRLNFGPTALPKILPQSSKFQPES